MHWTNLSVNIEATFWRLSLSKTALNSHFVISKCWLKIKRWPHTVKKRISTVSISMAHLRSHHEIRNYVALDGKRSSGTFSSPPPNPPWNVHLFPGLQDALDLVKFITGWYVFSIFQLQGTQKNQPESPRAMRVSRSRQHAHLRWSGWRQTHHYRSGRKLMANCKACIKLADCAGDSKGGVRKCCQFSVLIGWLREFRGEYRVMEVCVWLEVTFNVNISTGEWSIEPKGNQFVKLIIALQGKNIMKWS